MKLRRSIRDTSIANLGCQISKKSSSEIALRLLDKRYIQSMSIEKIPGHIHNVGVPPCLWMDHMKNILENQYLSMQMKMVKKKLLFVCF